MSDPGKRSPPRFPYAAATFCAACVGVATWLFLANSYAWDVTPKDVLEGRVRALPGGPPDWAFVRIRGRTGRYFGDRSSGTTRITLQDLAHDSIWIVARVPNDAAPSFDPCAEVRLTGHLYLEGTDPGDPVRYVDTRMSRWTGASVAGLVVAAMGVLVFGMTLRHWLARRRASAGPGEEAGP